VLPTLPGNGGYGGKAAAINDNGTIVGNSWDPAISAFRGVRWQRVGVSWTVAALASPGASNASAINTSGDIAGDACVGPPPCVQHAVIWPGGGALADIGTLGGASSVALGINNAGRVVGQAVTKTGYRRAFLWAASSGMQDIGALAGDRVSAMAFGVNDFGRIVGTSTAVTVGTRSIPNHGTVWGVP
jgi:probable HAF family extracellular repeat protein